MAGGLVHYDRVESPAEQKHSIVASRHADVLACTYKPLQYMAAARKQDAAAEVFLLAVSPPGKVVVHNTTCCIALDEIIPYCPLCIANTNARQ